MKAGVSGLIVYSSVCLMITYVSVGALCMCLLIAHVFTFAGWGDGVQGVDGWGGGWWCLDLISQEALCSRNLSFSLLRQWGEHVTLCHMVARVTCSLCLALNFWPLEQNLPTLMTPALLHLLPCSLSTLRSAPPLIWHVLVCLTGLCPSCCNSSLPYTVVPPSPTLSLCYRSLWLMIFRVNRSLTEFLRFCMFVCLLSVSPDKRLAGPLPSDLHPSTGELLPLARQTWLSSLPPTSIGLLSSHLCKYKKEREREM